jgi:thiol-disulfide isomerase/thioredoxin
LFQAAAAFEAERHRHKRDHQGSGLGRDFRHGGRGTAAGATAHPGDEEDKVAIFHDLGNLLPIRFRRLAAQLGITAGPEAYVVKPPPAPVKMLAIGAAAPDFPMTDLQGKPVKVSDYRGKVVILDFWATWCGPCIASMPHTQEVAAHYKDQGVVVLGSCTSDARGKFDAWVKTNQEKYPDFVFAHDPLEKDDNRPSRKLYGVGGIPTQFIIGRDGKIAATQIGYIKGEVMLDAALAKAGIKVDPAILAQAAEDQKKRDAMR